MNRNTGRLAGDMVANTTVVRGLALDTAAPPLTLRVKGKRQGGPPTALIAYRRRRTNLLTEHPRFRGRHPRHEGRGPKSGWCGALPRACWVLAAAMALTVLLAAAGPSKAREGPKAEAGISQPVPARPFALDALTMTGDWGGLRNRLEDRGIRFSVFWNQYYQSVLKGGLDTEGSGRGAASTDIFLTFDLEELGWLDEADVLLHLQANWGAGVNARTGGLFQTNDDADGSIGGHVAQFWYRHHFVDRKVSLMVGYLDYQTIVDRNVFANSEDKQFMHLTLDNNPLVPLQIGMGAALTVKPASWHTLILGVADAQARPYKGGVSNAFHDEDWYTVYLENGFSVSLPSGRGPLAGNYRMGVFYDPLPRAMLTRRGQRPERRGDDYGAYVSVDQMVYRESTADDQGLGVFGRFGYRDPEVHRMARFWSGGAQYKGLIPSRDADVLGFGFSLIRASHLLRSRVDDTIANEAVYEMYYAVQVTPWLVVTPDLQYIDNPGAAAGGPSHAITAGVRVRVSF